MSRSSLGFCNLRLLTSFLSANNFREHFRLKLSGRSNSLQLEQHISESGNQDESYDGGDRLRQQPRKYDECRPTSAGDHSP